MEQAFKKIVIIGGGFAGIQLAKKLRKEPGFHITLVDINNYHFFPPLLYQVASAFIEASNISYPFRRMFQNQENLRFHMGTFQKVLIDEQKVITNNGTISYDYLVFSHGTETNYFGMKNVQENAVPMKNITDALNLRNHLLLMMENTVRMQEEQHHGEKKALNIVVAGGGPTGVEIAGMLAELGQYVMKKEYPEIKELAAYIHLIDAGTSLLGPMSKKSQDEAYRVLKKLGVRIQLNTAVKDYVDGNVVLGDGQVIPTHALIWTSGVTGRETPGLPAESIGRGRRIVVNEYNAVIGTHNIFAIGDISLQTTDPKFPNGHPQLAQVAIQQGHHLARNFQAMLAKKPLKPFRYKDKGSMAIISKFKAVADLPNFSFKGFFAWLIWLFIHIIPIAGYRNKAKLASNWFWAFITNNPTLRLIIRSERKANS